MKVRGYQVAPAELEGHLLNHPDVSDVCVVPIPDDFSGEVPLAFIVIEANAVRRIASDPQGKEKLKAKLKKVCTVHLSLLIYICSCCCWAISTLLTTKSHTSTWPMLSLLTLCRKIQVVNYCEGSCEIRLRRRGSLSKLECDLTIYNFSRLGYIHYIYYFFRNKFWYAWTIYMPSDEKTTPI